MEILIRKTKSAAGHSSYIMAIKKDGGTHEISINRLQYKQFKATGWFKMSETDFSKPKPPTP